MVLLPFLRHPNFNPNKWCTPTSSRKKITDWVLQNYYRIYRRVSTLHGCHRRICGMWSLEQTVASCTRRPVPGYHSSTIALRETPRHRQRPAGVHATTIRGVHLLKKKNILNNAQYLRATPRSRKPVRQTRSSTYQVRCRGRCSYFIERWRRRALCSGLCLSFSVSSRSVQCSLFAVVVVCSRLSVCAPMIS